MSDEAGPPAGLLRWNVLITSRQGGQRRLRRVLSALVRLETRGFRNVLVGHVDDLEAFLSAVAERRARQPRVDEWLGKVLPIERTLRIDAARLEAQLQTESTFFLDRLVGRSFHVRVERRGHKGVVNTHACEQALGEYLFTALAARGQRPVVTFREPDAVVAVEIIGEVAGLGLVTRELRERFPFVKID